MMFKNIIKSFAFIKINSNWTIQSWLCQHLLFQKWQLLLFIIFSYILCDLSKTSVAAQSEITIFKNGTSDEQRLLFNLMETYEKSVRPVEHGRDTLRVHLGFTLTQLIDIDERNQVWSVNIWLDQQWKDIHLKWDPNEYGGLEKIRIPCNHIWLPDIVLYNSAEDYSTEYMRSRAMVSYDGTVFWPPIVKFRVSCPINITFFPFDEQVCRMKFGSWSYDGYQVDIDKLREDVSMIEYQENGEWQMKGHKIIRTVEKYDMAEEPFVSIYVYLHVKRKVLYYTNNIIIPTLYLSALTLTSFLLPPESGEKVTLGLTILLAYSVFTLVIAETMPPTSDEVPLICTYFKVIMTLTAISVFASIVIVRCYIKVKERRNRPPYLLKLLVIDILDFQFLYKLYNKIKIYLYQRNWWIGSHLKKKTHSTRSHDKSHHPMAMRKVDSNKGKINPSRYFTAKKTRGRVQSSSDPTPTFINHQQTPNDDNDDRCLDNGQMNFPVFTGNNENENSHIISNPTSRKDKKIVWKKKSNNDDDDDSPSICTDNGEEQECDLLENHLCSDVIRKQCLQPYYIPEKNEDNRCLIEIKQREEHAREERRQRRRACAKSWDDMIALRRRSSDPSALHKHYHLQRISEYERERMIVEDEWTKINDSLGRILFRAYFCIETTMLYMLFSSNNAEMKIEFPPDNNAVIIDPKRNYTRMIEHVKRYNESFGNGEI